jgi:hypothetical protein
MSLGSSTSLTAGYPEDDTLNTFEGALKWFSVQANSVGCVARKRWPDGIVRCPVCGGSEVRYLALRGLWECRKRHPKSQFSIRVGTIFEDSHIPLGLWLAGIWMVANLTKPSSHEVARRLGITQKSAWSMLRRIKCASKTAEEKRDSQFGLSVRDRQSESLRWE